MSYKLITQLTDMYMNAEHDILNQVLTMHLGSAPGKVEEFLIEKIHPFAHSPDYALHFDGYLLGYVKFEMTSSKSCVSFTPAQRDDQIKAVLMQVNDGLVSEKESEKKIDRLIDHWSQVDNLD